MRTSGIVRQARGNQPSLPLWFAVVHARILILRPWPLNLRPFRPAAFTLLELLVVLAVVGVLAAISVPVGGRMIESGRAAKCVSNLRQIGAALGLYLGEHNMTMPTLQAGRNSLGQDGAYIDNTLNAYTQGNAAVFACPSDRGEAARSGTSYYWNQALDGQTLSGLNFFGGNDHTRIVILADKAAYHPFLVNKVNFLYADGHAEKDWASSFDVK